MPGKDAIRAARKPSEVIGKSANWNEVAHEASETVMALCAGSTAGQLLCLGHFRDRTTVR